ncbi:putative calcium/calmodulin-dependent protein kinase type IV [Paratrimastix pyriformis]|uniref:Calcium/calmodulin-dependent protein kinase type IV n=1 Tax=Paratrimastix pyriformis TaxID=342808 RepID=A0ABQ8UE48_9EUKA|nr:putative calcium/calmodulin-dependent protein kinase type IV [Paratrimastix pyriformis]
MDPPTLAEWVVRDKLGGGAYGDVFKVKCSRIPNQFFAMKMFKEGIDRAAVRRRFEVQLNANNDNIVKAYLLYEPDGQPPRILMELCDNGDLFHMIDRPGLGPLDPQIIGFYFRQLCNALDALSQHGVIHRDLKLENLSLDKDFNLKVGDFGMAKCLAPDQTTMTVCGSPIYMAPEIGSGQGYTAKADIWSAGIILAVLIRRAYPYDGDASMDNPSFRAFLEPTSPVWAEVTAHMGDPRCTDLLRGMLAPDPAARLSIQQVLAHPWVQGLPTQPPEADRVKIKAAMARRHQARAKLSRPPRRRTRGVKEPPATPATENEPRPEKQPVVIMGGEPHAPPGDEPRHEKPPVVIMGGEPHAPPGDEPRHEKPPVVIMGGEPHAPPGDEPRHEKPPVKPPVVIMGGEPHAPPGDEPRHEKPPVVIMGGEPHAPPGDEPRHEKPPVVIMGGEPHAPPGDEPRHEKPPVVIMGAEKAVPVGVTTRFDLADAPMDLLMRRLKSCLGSVGRPVGECTWKGDALHATLDMPSGPQLEVLLRLSATAVNGQYTVAALRVNRLQGDEAFYEGPFLGRIGQEIEPWLPIEWLPSDRGYPEKRSVVFM